MPCHSGDISNFGQVSPAPIVSAGPVLKQKTAGS